MNFSKLQNEQDVSLQIILGNATFNSYYDATSPINMNFNSSSVLVVSPMTNNLVYGANVYQAESIIVTKEALTLNSEVIVSMAISGIRSPLKYSDYVFVLSRLSSVSHNDFNHLIKEAQENILAIDRKDKIGSSKSKTLKLLLGRESK